MLRTTSYLHRCLASAHNRLRGQVMKFGYIPSRTTNFTVHRQAGSSKVQALNWCIDARQPIIGICRFGWQHILGIRSPERRSNIIPTNHNLQWIRGLARIIIGLAVSIFNELKAVTTRRNFKRVKPVVKQNARKLSNLGWFADSERLRHAEVSLGRRRRHYREDCWMRAPVRHGWLTESSVGVAGTGAMPANNLKNPNFEL